MLTNARECCLNARNLQKSTRYKLFSWFSGLFSLTLLCFQKRLMTKLVDFSNFNNLLEMTSYFCNEEICKEAIIETRWGAGDMQDVVCPYCGAHHCVRRKDGKFRCQHCLHNFSYKVGTIFEDSKLSLVKWFIAMYLISSHKKGTVKNPYTVEEHEQIFVCMLVEASFYEGEISLLTDAEKNEQSRQTRNFSVRKTQKH